MIYTDFLDDRGGGIADSLLSENICTNDAVTIENDSYLLGSIQIDQDLKLNTYYTITIYGDLHTVSGTNNTTVNVYMGNGSNGSKGFFLKIREGVYGVTVSSESWNDAKLTRSFQLYCYYNEDNEDKYVNRIDFAKVTIGPDDKHIWTPNLSNYAALQKKSRLTLYNNQLDLYRMGYIVNIALHPNNLKASDIIIPEGYRPPITQMTQCWLISGNGETKLTIATAYINTDGSINVFLTDESRVTEPVIRLQATYIC